MFKSIIAVVCTLALATSALAAPSIPSPQTLQRRENTFKNVAVGAGVGAVAGKLTGYGAAKGAKAGAIGGLAYNLYKH
ncbi:hypothetical protein H4R35_001074 [Dimargaris xerosporica]|nr:hypothetical protein H4R35_001074 [Dimargaris xerosporica]